MQSSTTPPAGPARPPLFAEDEFTRFDAVGQARLVQAGEVSALELLEAAARRIEAVNPSLNAIAALDLDRARSQCQAAPRPQGPLAGVPTLVKDLMPYPGLPTAFGSRAMGAAVATEGSDYTAALQAAGLVVLGKSTTSELGLLGTTETLACGATRNPWNPAHSSGGSSGGAVVAVASGMVPVAHASDGGGSIRGPAAFTGLFGYKPSRGLTRSTGPAEASPLGFMVSDHCVSRSVRDSAAWLEATLARPLPQGRLPRSADEASKGPLRVAVYSRTGFGLAPEPEVQRVLEQAMRLCEAAGHHVVECAGPHFDAERTSDAFFLLAGATLAGLFEHLRLLVGPAFSPEGFEPLTRTLAQRALDAGPEAFAQAMEAVRASVDTASRAFASADVLLCPTTPFTARPLGETTPESPLDQVVQFTQQVAGYTAIASMAGWCAMSVPLGRSSAGLPIGMHFAGPQGADQRLFGLACQLEALAPWR